MCTDFVSVKISERVERIKRCIEEGLIKVIKPSKDEIRATENMLKVWKQAAKETGISA